MGKGFLIGILFGAVFSATALSAVSLMAPPVGSRIVIVSADPPVEALESVPDQVEPAVVPPPDVSETVSVDVAVAQEPQDVPDVAMIEIPAGSDFARPKTDGETILPGSEPAPPIATVPEVSAPQNEPAPQLADVTPAAAPVGQAEAPTVMITPESPSSEASMANLAIGAPTPSVALAETPVLGSSPADDHSAPNVDTSPPISADTSEVVTAAPIAPEIDPAALANISQADAGSDAAVVSVPDPAPQTAFPAPQVSASEGQLVEEPVVAEASSAPAKPAMPASDPAGLVPVETVTEPVATPEPETETRIEQAQATLPEVAPIVPGQIPTTEIGNAAAPQPGFSETVPGVKINRLPSIGEPATDESVTDESGSSVVEDVAPADPEDLPAVMRFALNAEVAPGKPVFAVIILDVGQSDGGVDPGALAALALPVTIAVSPTDTDAATRAEGYRRAGLEVAILVPRLPEGANAADMEVSYQSYVATLPETVALIGQPDAQFQTDRRAAEHLAALLAADGRGLVSYSRGLNPAGQAAEKEGIPHSAIYRVLDTDHESAATISRYLDRAAFEAEQKGFVLVVGHSYPETIAALKDWAAAGAKGSAIAPVTAAMLAERPLN